MWSWRGVMRVPRLAAVYVRSYTLPLLMPLVGPRVRFVVFATARSGSTLLVSLLDGHPDIRCEPEVLRVRPPHLPATRFLGARAVRARIRFRTRAYGCKVVAGQAMRLEDDQRSTFLSDMHRRGFQIIVVTRRDVLARAVSRLDAARTGKWIYRDGQAVDRPPLELTPKQIEKELDFTERTFAFVEDAVKDLPHIRVVYEDDLDTPEAQQATLDRICAELSLPSAKAKTSLVRSGATSMRERIANYDEVMEHLRHTRFAAYAEPAVRTPPDGGGVVD